MDIDLLYIDIKIVCIHVEQVNMDVDLVCENVVIEKERKFEFIKQPF
jgi:hypothetical protein